MYLGGALRRTPFFAIRRPGRGSHFGQCGDLNRDAFWAVGGGIFARDREDSAPTVGGERGDCDDWRCDERARPLAICRERGTFAGQ